MEWVAQFFVKSRPWMQFLVLELLGLALLFDVVALDGSAFTLERPGLAIQQHTLGLAFVGLGIVSPASRFLLLFRHNWSDVISGPWAGALAYDPAGINRVAECLKVDSLLGEDVLLLPQNDDLQFWTEQRRRILEGADERMGHDGFFVRLDEMLSSLRLAVQATLLPKRAQTYTIEGHGLIRDE